MSAENLKWRINRAVRKSNLPAPARLIMFVLSDMADAKTGVIPEKMTPSLRVLAQEAGLGESTVKEQLLVLEQLGWVLRERPDGERQARHGSTGYQLQIGSAGEKRAPAKRKPRASSKPPKDGSEGQEMAPAEGQEMAPDNESGGQELATRGPGASSSGARRWPPIYKDDDRDDRNDRNAAADAATHGDGGALFDADLPAPKPETENQRANRLARIYTSRVKLSNFNAVFGVVRAAARATTDDGRPLYTDQQITDALNKLADDGWSVSANTLRIAIEGPPRTAFGASVPHQGYRQSPEAKYGRPTRRATP